MVTPASISRIDQPLVPWALLSHQKTQTILGFDPMSPERFSIYAEQLTPWSSPFLLPDGRQKLSKDLVAYNQSIGQDEIAIQQARLLQDPETLAVVTGQQAGLCLGPLYTVYKIVTAILLAKAQSEALKRPVVPIFWNATEDHDMSEVLQVSHIQRTFTAEAPRAGIAAERLALEGSIRDTLNAYLESITIPQFKEDLTAWLNQPHDSYGPFSSALVAKLFAGTGLVILEPRLLRPYTGAFWEQVLSAPKAVAKALTEGSSQMESLGLEPAFSPDHECGLFEIMDDGIRRKVLLREDERLLLDDEWMVAADVLVHMQQEPGRYSTSAYLRPVLQGALLPTLAYVAGPGEFKYHLQLRPLFDHLKVPMPILHLRNQATLLSAKESLLAARLKLDDEALFSPREAFYYREELSSEDEDALESANIRFDYLMEHLERDLTFKTDPRRIAAFRARWQQELTRLKQKMHADFLRQAGIDNGRVDRLFDVVRPGNKPQERVLSILPFLEVTGFELIGLLMDTFKADSHEHLVIHLEQTRLHS